MAKGRHKDSVRLLGVVRRKRAALLVSTALQASVLIVFAVPGFSSPAMAQPAPNARPTGGTVIAGSASISRAPTQTTINQSSNRAALSWQTYNVGSQQSVVYHQPSSSSVTLNRVEDPNPSQIAGRIEANGSIVLMNQAGVTFYKGAQVNANGLMVTAASMSDRAMKGFVSTGAMQFDRAPDPNARVENRGNITIKQAGLAALVAPSVANSGTIDARLGHVVLAGADHTTLDMYGDGLVSIDVSGEVKKVPVGPDGKPVTALVTNTGVIRADGGVVQLTARQADGVVTKLVDAGGRISADSVDGHTGVVALNGIGGDIVVQGQLSAAGKVAASKGGDVKVNTTGNVSIASSAHIDASGQAGGGTVALGTTLARAKGGPSVTPTLTAANVHVAKGAVVRADATAKGDGGHVTVLSTDTTTMQGTISAKGGPQGGDGGNAEVSGGVLALSGHVNLSAPQGTTGTLLLDPSDLWLSDQQPVAATYPVSIGDLPTITAGGAPDGTTVSWVSPALLEGENANIALAATNNLYVAATNGTSNTLNLGSHTLSLDGGDSLTIDRGFSITAGGITLNGGASGITFDGSSGVTGGLITAPQLAALTPTSVQASGAATTLTMVSGGTIALHDATLGSSGTPIKVLDLSAAGDVSQTSSGTIFAGTLQSTSNAAGDVGLESGHNQIGTIAAFAVTGAGHSFSLAEAAGQNLAITGPLIAPQNITLTTSGTGAITASGSIDATAGTLTVKSGSAGIALNTGAVLTAPLIALNGGAGAIGLSGSAQLGHGVDIVDLTAGAGVSEGGTSSIIAGTLQSTGGVTGGNVVLSNSNAVATVGSFAVSGGSFTLADADNQSLMTSGSLTASQNVKLTTGGTGTLAINSNVSATAVTLTAGGAALTQNASSTITGTSSVAATGTALTLGGTITDGGSTPGTGTVTLTATGPGAAGTIDVSSGVIVAGTLSGSAASAANLTMPTNQVGTLGPFNTEAGFSLVDNQALRVDGPVTDTGGASALTLTTRSGDLTLDGNVSAFNALALISAGAISQSGGSISAATLSGSAASAANLTMPTNQVGTLGTFAVTTGIFALDAPGTLNIFGTVSASNIYLQSGTIGFETGGQLSVNGGRIGLQTDKLTNLGTIGATGSVSAGSAGVFELAPNSNAQVTLGADDGLSLTDLTGITASTIRIGAITQPISGSLSTVASAITLAGAFDAGGANLDLESNGGISQGTSASLTNVSALTLNAGNIELTDASNRIDKLGNINATTLALRDTGSLSVSGSVSANGITLTSDTIGIPGTLNTTGTIALLGTAGGISEPGALIAGTLTGNTGMSEADFSGAGSSANQIGTLADFVANGFTLRDAKTLTQTGSLSAGNTLVLNDTDLLSLGGTATAANVTLNAGTIAVGGSIDAKNVLALDITADGISETGGITAGTLSSSSIQGGATLTGFNAIGTLGMLAVNSGDFRLNNIGSLSVSGTVSADDITLTSDTIGIPGTLNTSGTIVLVGTAGGISEPGALIAGTLTGNTGMSEADFSGAGSSANQIGTLADFVANGFTLRDAKTLTQTGSLNGGSMLVLKDTNLLRLGGTLTAAHVVLNAGSINEAGLITASAPGTPSLPSVQLVATNGTIGEASTGAIVSTNASGLISLTASSDIDTAGSIGATGTVYLSAGGSIHQIGGVIQSNGSGSIDISGTAAAPNLLLTANGGTIDQSAGAMLYAPDTAGVIELRANNDLLLNGLIQARGGDGGVFLASTNGSILQSAATGTLRANTLLGSAGKSVMLNGTSSSGNLIADLASFSAGMNGGGDFVLTDGQDLTINGPVVANTGSMIITATHFAGNPPSSLDNRSTILGQTGVTLTADTDVTNLGTIEAPNHSVALTANSGTLGTSGLIGAATLIALQALNNDMLLGGILSAPTIQANAGANQITLNSGSTIMTDGTIRPYGTHDVLPPDAFTTEGAYFTAGSFQQRGVGTVRTLAGNGNVLRINVSRGPIDFSASGLNAPNTWLILNGADGFISGAIHVRALDVLFNGAFGRAELTGTVNGFGGQAAAGVANIEAGRNAKYKINSCPIESVSCVVLTVESIPAGNPLKELDIGAFFNPDNEDDLLLPIVTNREGY